MVEAQSVKEVCRWSQAELQWLKDNYGKMPFAQMAKMLNRPTSSISHQCQRLGLSPKKPMWTEAEKRKFFAEYGPKSLGQLAAELGKTYAAVRHFAARHKWG